MTTREDIIERARAMVPVLRERAKDAETLRRLPDETHQEFLDAGFYRVLQPAAFGGLELDFGTQTELAVQLGPGCASSAWVASVIACHGWLVGMFSPQAQEEVWGADPNIIIASSFLPMGPDIQRVDGGVQVSGRWGFSSGVNHCRWIFVTMDIHTGGKDGEKDSAFALLPLEECTIEDSWYTTGLAASGSNNVVIENRFIPDHRILYMKDLRGGPTPGSAANPGYLYQLPQRATFSFNLIGAAIGAARGAIETAIDQLITRNTVSGAKLAELSSVQYRIAEAESELAAAYALMARNRDEIIRDGKDGALPSIEDRARYRRDNAYCAKLCVQAVDRVYPIMGGRGIAAENAVNRAWRDVHAISHHISMSWDVQASSSGALSVGLPNTDMLL